MVSRVIPVDVFDLVVFGATGDLSKRKILPGLFHRFSVGQMPTEARIIGAARSDMTADAFRDIVRQGLIEFAPKFAGNTDVLNQFLKQIEYVSVDAKGDKGWDTLAGLMRPDTVRAFYLSVAPSLFGTIADKLNTHPLPVLICSADTPVSRMRSASLAVC